MTQRVKTSKEQAPPLLLPNLINNNSLNNIAFDANIANTLTLVLTNLNAILVEDRESKTVNYSTFSERGEKDIDDFITKLEKAFIVNKVFDNKKYIVIASCLKGMVANLYNRLVGLTK